MEEHSSKMYKKYGFEEDPKTGRIGKVRSMNAKSQALKKAKGNSTPRSREISEAISRGKKIGRETHIKHLHGEY